ncbi:MAG: PQQ-binding-like beta-propeller repeat protein [Micrococcales bacterium]|nr:PQQ-binding-like beta-propeller repeat protein [Micrococcales bacterium]
MPDRPPRPGAKRGRHGGRWLLLGLVAALAWVPGCTDQTGSDPATTSPSTLGVPFDPPTGFDLTRAVTLTQDQALHGTLHGTTLLSFADGALVSIDLLTGRPSWSVDLSADTARDYLYPPYVLDRTVVLATGQPLEDPTPEENYAVDLVAVSLDTGTITWQRSFELQAFGRYLARPQDMFDVKMIERDDGLVVSVGLSVEPFTTALLDSATGEVRWQADLMVVGASTGRYAVAVSGDGMFPVRPVALDLETGQVLKALSDLPDQVSYSPLPDPGGDLSAVAVAIVPEDSATVYLRMSSVDATTEQFTPGPDDVRYAHGLQCFPEEDQAVMLCRGYGKGFRSVYGVEVSTGRLVWSWAGEGYRIDYATQHHGHVYGMQDGRSVVLAMDTDEIVNRDVGVEPLRQLDLDHTDEPVKVNEYGMVGMVKSHDSQQRTDTYVWVPANR